MYLSAASRTKHCSISKSLVEHGDFYNYEFLPMIPSARNTDVWKACAASLKVRYDSVQAEISTFAAVNDTGKGSITHFIDTA